MKTTRRTMPRTVKVLCVILVLLPLVEGAVRYSQAQSHVPRWQYVPSVWMSLVSFALYVCLAAGLARGINWMRWCFVIVAAIGLILQFIVSTSLGPIIATSPPPLPMAIGTAVWIAYLTAVVLCLVPSADDYFRQKQSPNQAPTSTAVTLPADAGDRASGIRGSS
jgi:hypothetical protein